LDGVQLTAIGALAGANLAYFDLESKQYRPIPVTERVEVASMVGVSGRQAQRACPCRARTPRWGALAGHLLEAREAHTRDHYYAEGHWGQ
jgi:uncharacterized protein